jgi:DNA topoisomerase-1
VKHRSLYANIPKAEDPAAITLERAIELIQVKQAGAAANILKVFDGSAIQVLKGKYGPYVTDGKLNANVPKGKEPDALTLDDCVKLLDGPTAKKPVKKKGGFRRKKA